MGAFVLVSNDSPTLCTACGMLALGMLVAARLGFVAGKSQQPVGHAASYKRACILLALFLLHTPEHCTDSGRELDVALGSGLVQVWYCVMNDKARVCLLG